MGDSLNNLRTLQAKLDLSSIEGLKSLNVDAKNTGTTFLGSETTYSGIQLDWFGFEMCILFIIQLYCFSGMLGKLNGRFMRMVQWIHFLDFEILGITKQPKNGCLVTLLCIVGYSYIFMPILTLILWGAFLFNNSGKKDRDLDYKNSEFLGGIGVYLIGTGMILCVLTLKKISWNNYRFKLNHMLVLLLSYIMFTVWQFMVMFASIEGDYNFKGLSSVMLTQSGVMMCGLIYVNLYENKFNLIYFLNKFVKKDGPMPDPERTNDILAEIQKNKTDEDWMPSINDIFDMITIGRISDKKMMNAFGKGFQQIAMDKSICVRLSINGTLFMIYIITLIVYSWIDYDRNDRSKLALISATAVVVNDIYVYLMYNARIIERVSVLALLIFCSRFFIMLGGEDYWVYGYLVIFIWLECLISLGIVERRLPYNTDMDINKVDSAALIKKTKFTDLARVPEFIFVLIAVSLVISIVIADSLKPQGVRLGDIDLNDDEDAIGYGAATGLSILIVISFFFVVAWIRAFKRKLDNTTGDTYLYLFSRKVDQYYICCLCCYMVCIFWTLGAYPYIDNDNVLVTGFMVPAIAFFFLNVFIIYMKNGYFFVEDTYGINRNFKAHNKRVDLLKVKARGLRSKLQEEGGVENVYGEENGRLVQKVMDMEVARRKAVKLAKEIQGDQEDQDDEKFNRLKTSGFGRSVNSRSAVAVSPVKNDRSLQLEDIDNDQEIVAVDATESVAIAPKSPSKQFGDTMLGFKLDEESSEEDYDAIPAEMRPYRPSRIDKKRKLISTWQQENIGFFTAFFSGKMRPNDYVMMWSLIFMITLTIIYGAASAAVTEKNLGILFAFTVLHVILLGISMMGNIAANRQAETWERGLQVGTFVMIYIVGLIYLFVVYDVSLLNKDDKDLTIDEIKEKQDGRDFITGDLIIIPFVTAFIAFCAKAYRDNVNGRSMTTGFWILLVLNFLQGTLLTIAIFIYQSSDVAWLCLFALSFTGYAFVQYILLVKYSTRPIMISEKISISPYMIKKTWFVMDIILALGVFIGTIIYVGSDDTISDFASASAVIAIALIILLFAVLAQLVKDRTQLDQMPIYHSPWIFPIYKYYPEENDIEPYSSSIVGFYTIAFLVTLWAIAATAEISPNWFGIAITCVIESLVIVATLYYTNTNNLQFNKVKTHVDELTIKSAWLDSKENLVRMLQIDNRASYVSYETWWRRRFDLKNYLQIWRGNGLLSWPDQVEYEEIKDEFASTDNPGALLRQRLEKWADPDEVDLDCWEDCQKFMYLTDQDVKKAYMAELETIIQFQLIILQNAKALAETEKKYLFKFIKEKRAQLYLVGINFEILNSSNPAINYANALAEIRKMTPDKQTLFNALKIKFIDEQRQKQIEEDLAEQREEEKNEERMRALSQMSDKRQAAMRRMLADPNMPVDDMPDCMKKLDKIRDECKTNTTKFTDAQFDHAIEEEVLGTNIYQNKSSRAITGWARASEIEGSVLFRDGASHEDINQGALGDCYFLSALSVLGNDRTVELFKCQGLDQKSKNPNDENYWKNTGCFMVEFFKEGAPVWIIVDDWIPMCGDLPAFTNGGEDGLEMWPAILEKAYAKLYGSYQAIEAGKVHMALADMVNNGFPEQLALKSFKNNLKVFQNRVRKLYKNEALMGAGSPEHDQGDKAVNEEGIVQGHAYAILQVQDFQGEQLLQLRNPHGRISKEWLGDWADDSEKWTSKAEAALKYEPNEQIDGIFWMNNNDFLHNFKYIYATRELTEKAGWSMKTIDSKWEGISSAGFPGKLRSVPQFKLTIHKPCSGYISLTQKGDFGSAFKGKNFIGWMATRNQGKIVTKLDKRSMITKAGISDLKLLSSEIEFDEKVSYPYTFTILCGSNKAGQEGEGEFEIRVYSRDPKMKLEKLNHVDQ